MNAGLQSLLAGLVSGLITAVITYYATLSKARLDLAILYDKELRESRLEAYRELWKRLKPLARYSPEAPVTCQVLRETSESMRDWYFEIGGIFLSRESRKPYFDLKDKMQEIIEGTKAEDEEVAVVGDPLKALHDLGTALRESLSDDIGSRQMPFLR